MIAESTSLASDRNKWVRIAVWLSWFTIVYNLIEGAVSIRYGVTDDSVSLAGFGADSLIEVASAILVLWRFRGETGSGQSLSEVRERKATFGIGALFLFLAALTLVASGYQLYLQSHPQTTIPGLVISLLSLSFMFALWKGKLAAAKALDSLTVEKDALCSLACIKLSSILFIGSVLFMLFPRLWWVDSVAGLGLAFLIGKEGWETLQSSRAKDFKGGCGCH